MRQNLIASNPKSHNSATQNKNKKPRGGGPNHVMASQELINNGSIVRSGTPDDRQFESITISSGAQRDASKVSQT